MTSYNSTIIEIKKNDLKLQNFCLTFDHFLSYVRKNN